jgi:thiopurine S-methyltransferase
MDPEFWHERWSRGEIGFHQHEYNAHMQAFTRRLGIDADAHVLVPLCGKSRDMIWLAEAGYRVTGIEISERAVRDFYRENTLRHVEQELPGARLFRSDRIDIYCADFFTAPLAEMPPVEAVYDRASLIALPPPMRPAYAERLSDAIPPGVRSLLITLEYPQEEMRGPPFSVQRDEVARLFGRACRIEELHGEDCLAREPRFRAKGLTRLEERVYLLHRLDACSA